MLKLNGSNRATRNALMAGFVMLIGLPLSQVAAQEGGIEVFAGETLFRAGTRASITHIYKRKGRLLMGHDEISDPNDGLFEEHRTVLSIDHGFLPDWQVSLLVPHVEKKRETNALGTQRGIGIGDTAALLKYMFHQNKWKRSGFFVSVVGGLEMPTGKTSERDAGIRLPPALQPGSGSWDPFFALAATLDLDRWRFDGVVFYKVNTEGAQDFDEGDFLSIDASVAYRFLHTKYPGPTASAKVGLQFRYQGHDQMRGQTISSSGSSELLVRTGLTFHPTPAWDLKVSVDLPIYQDMNGTQLAQDVRLFVGVGIRF